MRVCVSVHGYNLLVTLGLILGAVILHERGLQAEASTQVTATHFAVTSAASVVVSLVSLSAVVVSAVSAVVVAVVVVG